MDAEDMQASSKADAATVKRKRRLSILKNQRPLRTPFSEVEFKVATPPETIKSRRVSSRRTGVAELVTNEATTTWRNFYEEQNQSLELLGNENNLVGNGPRQTIEHIGKIIFDQQFEEVEAFVLGGTIHPNPLQASFNEINLTQELVELECLTGDAFNCNNISFVPSESKFEQSALTELSKLFGNDIQCPVLEDMTNPISMNFSTMQPLSSGNCDDLDEIQNDLESTGLTSAMCPGPINPGKDFSGYIEVAELDVTHGPIHNDGSEMSITDTVESPKVVQLSKQKVDDDWANDKNMLFNPYVAPKESLKFAVNKVSDEVLVFDGKRLRTQSIINNIFENKKNLRQIQRNITETKGTLQLPMRLSSLRRQYTVISLEEIFNNISMAKAALQQLRFEVDETDIMDDTSELIETHEINDTHTSVRLSSEVVKKLQFEDESASDISITPLRKPTDDEITSTNDKNKNGLPTFIADVSVTVKELMHNLVKPNCEALFESNFSDTNAPLTRNAEVEANLITSSQIDVTQDEPSQFLLKNSDHYNISKKGTKNMVVEVDSVCLLHDIKSSVAYSQSINIVQHSTDKNSKDIAQKIVKNDVHEMIQSPQKLKQKSIVFNSNDPLKNILLPVHYSDAHRYNQYKKRGDDDKTKSSSSRVTNIDDKSSGRPTHNHYDEENDAMTNQKISEHVNIVCGEITGGKSGASSDSMSVCEPHYADKSVESVIPTLKDIEVNTIIVMKENRDLIQSSSLTLVDERVSSYLKINIESSTEPSQEAIGTVSPVKILFRNENDHNLAVNDSEANLSEEISNINLDANTRKRSYSPTQVTNNNDPSNVKVPPKPLNKMQKMSNGLSTRTAFNKIDTMQVDKDETKNLKKGTQKYAQTEIVQKVEVQYNSKSNSKVAQKSQSNNSDIEKAVKDKDSLNLFFSSDSIQDPSVTILQVVSSITSAIPMDEERDKIYDYDPNVVENIKRLSFMGTSECEWEECGREAWSFRLLSGRVRTRVRLCGAAMSVDTPVTAVDFEVAKADEKDAIAGMCVSLAMEAMRYEAAEVSRANAVEAMLQRCVRVARLARRWARAMRDAYLHLAYRVLPDGHISLKVVILPLRRVVEARMHVSLAVGREHGVAYPRADHLTLVSEAELTTEAGPSVAPPRAKLDRLVDQTPDWGNVPRTIWKVFRYLKNRTSYEEPLG